MEYNDNSEENYSNREYLSENVSSQEPQSSGMLVASTSRRSSGKIKKAKKLNYKKRVSAKVRRDNLHYTPVHDR